MTLLAFMESVFMVESVVAVLATEERDVTSQVGLLLSL